MKKVVFMAMLLSISVASAFAQARPTTAPETTPPTSGQVESSRTDQAAERLQLAISSIDYPVTPGDIYQLSYRESAGAIVTRQFQVDGISILDLGVFGKIFALNMPFYQLKQNVENLISRNYTYSTPSLSIIAPGVFRVAVRDGSSRVQYVTAWGLSRISEIVLMADSPNSSIRDIERISRELKSEHFDLLRSTNSSSVGSDLFVRPGDTIVLHRAERTIELRGEIRRPGRYELIGDEGIRDLIEVFGEGVTSKADMERLRIIRSSDTGERIDYVSFKESYAANSRLNDGDIVTVGDKTSKRALVWFEGAVTAPIEDRSTAVAGSDQGVTAAQFTTNGRFSHPISEGVLLSDILREVLPSILPSADLGSVLLSKPGLAGSVVIDIRPLLTGLDLSRDTVLTANTTVFIPLLRSSVSVAGAVIAPGFVPYLPGAPASYYVSLCGGFNPERNVFGTLIVYDQFGKIRTKDHAVMPGDSIFVKNNAIGYILERTVTTYAPIVTTLITVITFGVSMGLINVGN
jgi:polysaccharide biosynthesis/export protein